MFLASENIDFTGLSHVFLLGGGELYDLFYGKDPRDGKSLADLISLNFEGFYFRGTCLDLGEFDEVHGFRFEEQPKIFDIDYLVSFCEYIYNFVLHFEDHYFFGQINKSFYLQQIKKWFVGLQGDILPIDDEVQENVKKVVTSNPQLVDFKQVKSSGDAFLIATAMKYDLTVITEENKTGQKKIPFVCNSLGVPCVDILGLCEKEGWSF